MSDENIIPEDEGPRDDILAAELSLGLLDGDDLVQAQRRARTDRAFAELVADWDMRFATLTDDIAPVAPPKGVFKKIAAKAHPESPKRIWQQLGVFPALFGAAAAALVLILALQFGGLMQPSVQTPTLVAEMVAEDRSIVVAAAYVEDSNRLIVDWQIGTRPPKDRDVEVWLISGSDAPVSIGILTQGEHVTEFSLPADLRARLPGAVLAVSDEPFGGSDTGAPTGPVLAVGEVSTL